MAATGLQRHPRRSPVARHQERLLRLPPRPAAAMRLSRTTDCRIFSDKKAPDIIREVFNECGFNNFRDALAENFPEARILRPVPRNRSGIRLAPDGAARHLLFLQAQQRQAHAYPRQLQVVARAGAGSRQIPFIPLAGDDRRDREHIYHWATERRFRTGKVELNDYDFKQPGKKLLADAKASEKYTKSDLEYLRLSRQVHRARCRRDLRQDAARSRAGARSSPTRHRRCREPVSGRPDQARKASEGFGERAIPNRARATHPSCRSLPHRRGLGRGRSITATTNS